MQGEQRNDPGENLQTGSGHSKTVRCAVVRGVRVTCPLACDQVSRLYKHCGSKRNLYQEHVTVGVCVCLHLLVGELMSAGGAGFLVEVLVRIHHLLGSVLMLVDAGVFGPHAAPHRSAQL